MGMKLGELYKKTCEELMQRDDDKINASVDQVIEYLGHNMKGFVQDTKRYTCVFIQAGSYGSVITTHDAIYRLVSRVGPVPNCSESAYDILEFMIVDDFKEIEFVKFSREFLAIANRLMEEGFNVGYSLDKNEVRLIVQVQY